MGLVHSWHRHGTQEVGVVLARMEERDYLLKVLLIFTEIAGVLEQGRS